MKKGSSIASLFLTLLLLWMPGHGYATVGALSQSQSPSQLATASVVPVKISGSDADALLLLYRQSDDAAASSGSAGDVTLSFYNASGDFIRNVTMNLTEPEVELGNSDGTPLLVSQLFDTTGSGVILVKSTGGDARVGASILQVDYTIPAIYERQSLPAIVRENLAGSTASGANDSVWGGFSTATFEEFFLSGGGFDTDLQFVCPPSGSDLADAMTAIASLGTLSASPRFSSIRVYDEAGTLLGTLSNVSCSAYTENPGTVKTTMATVPNIMGFLYMTVNSAAAGWRTVVLTVEGASVWFDGWIRRKAGTVGE